MDAEELQRYLGRFRGYGWSGKGPVVPAVVSSPSEPVMVEPIPADFEFIRSPWSPGNRDIRSIKTSDGIDLKLGVPQFLEQMANKKHYYVDFRVGDQSYRLNPYAEYEDSQIEPWGTSRLDKLQDMPSSILLPNLGTRNIVPGMVDPGPPVLPPPSTPIEPVTPRSPEYDQASLEWTNMRRFIGSMPAHYSSGQRAYELGQYVRKVIAPRLPVQSARYIIAMVANLPSWVAEGIRYGYEGRFEKGEL